MAKKRSKATSTAATTERPPVKLTERDVATLKRIIDVADDVQTAADKRREPHLDVPARTLSNVKYNRQKKFIEMGKATNRRQLFNLSQAKVYMQSLLVASGSKRLIDEGKTL